MDFSGRTALVTGANRGIGTAFVHELVRLGCSSVLATARDVAALDPLVQEYGDVVRPVHLDLEDSASVAAIPDAVGDVDVVVHNAGISVPGAVSSVSEEELLRMFRVNAFRPVLLLRGLEDVLVSRQGAVLVVASSAAFLMSRTAPAYAASKRAVSDLVHAYASELRPRGVGVTIAYPGYVATDMTAAMPQAKASPESVARLCLEALARGDATVFPDDYSAEVRRALDAGELDLVDEPMTTARAFSAAYWESRS